MKNNDQKPSQEVIKQTPVPLYILVPSEKDDGVHFTLLGTKGMKSLEGIAPTKEILEAHFAAERVRMAIANRDDPYKKYVPQPLYIDTMKDSFHAIVEEAKKKYNQFDENTEHIALSLGVQIPCCIIGIRDDEKDKK